MTLPGGKDQSRSGTTISYATPREVSDFHRNSDRDKSAEAQHHSLGTTRFQASSGAHVHDGSSAGALFDQAGSGIANATFNQNLGNAQGLKAAVKQLIQLLTQYGAVDSTTNVGVYPNIQYGAATMTWTAAGTVSDTIVVTFPTVFAVIPKVLLVHRSTASYGLALKVNVTATTAGFSMQGVAMTSQGAGATTTVDWVAIANLTYV